MVIEVKVGLNVEEVTTVRVKLIPVHCVLLKLKLVKLLRVNETLVNAGWVKLVTMLRVNERLLNGGGVKLVAMLRVILVNAGGRVNPAVG